MSNETLAERIRADWPKTRAILRERFEKLSAEIGPALARGELVECSDHDPDEHLCNCVEVDGYNVLSCDSCRKRPAAVLEDDDMGGILLCSACKTEGDAEVSP